MKIFPIAIAILIGVTLLIEFGLRLTVGLGNPPLYIADEEIGYLLAPNQKLRRRGNLIKVNQYSMRSDEIEPEKPDNRFRVFLLGDSIVNGGWWTDQTEILSEFIETEIAQMSDRPVEAINASANSWGPRNQLAYLQKFGLFDADVLILVINTDDLFATAPTSVQVGRDLNYPNRRPPLALIELYQRYLAKSPEIPELEKVRKEPGDRVGRNLQAIEEIKHLAAANNTQFILAMTPLLRELQGDGSREYELKARKRLQEFTANQNITYIDFLPIFADFPQPEFLYRDSIHLTVQGNHMVSKTLAESAFSVISEQ
ncbi:MAG: SGNH/GDSL hydrolase family protein [Pleurocapsa sp.]